MWARSPTRSTSRISRRSNHCRLWSGCCCKTGRTIATGAFPEDWPTLSETCVRTLLGRGLRLLGVDAPSVDTRDSKNLPVHHMMFSGNGAILENLDLRQITPTMYELIAFPLKLMALDAAPVSAVLRQIVV